MALQLFPSKSGVYFSTWRDFAEFHFPPGTLLLSSEQVQAILKDDKRYKVYLPFTFHYSSWKPANTQQQGYLPDVKLISDAWGSLVKDRRSSQMSLDKIVNIQNQKLNKRSFLKTIEFCDDFPKQTN